MLEKHIKRAMKEAIKECENEKPKLVYKEPTVQGLNAQQQLKYEAALVCTKDNWHMDEYGNVTKSPELIEKEEKLLKPKPKSKSK